jgi:hypothetical protein
MGRTKKEIKKENIKCTSCGVEKKPDDFYSSYSPFHKSTSHLHVCKQCIWDYVGEDNDLNKILTTLRMLDKPYITDLWESSIQECEKSGKSPFKIYMKNLGLRQNRELTWDDSSFENFNSIKKMTSKISMTTSDVEHELSNEDINFLKSFWGNFDIDDLIWLQNEYEDWTNRYECDSKGMETLIQEICLTKFDIKNRRASGEKVDQQLKTLQDLLGSSNLKPVQETGANAVEQETFGTLIKKYENEKPIPEPDEKWKDVDGITKYIRIFFTGHLARMLGIKNENENEYWEEINKYTVEEPTDEDDEDLEDVKL